ncbi:MAG: hypothetical protein RIR62_1343 [Pseudomonadota bacterium]|jgi:hypothetical protein
MPDREKPDRPPPAVPPAARPPPDIQPPVAPTPPAPDVTPSPSPDDLTADALRHSLDRGRGGEKVNVRNPAAAPPGTDDGAAGHPPTREQIRMAAAAELGPRPPEAPRARRGIADLAKGGMRPWPVLLLALVVVTVLAVLVAG